MWYEQMQNRRPSLPERDFTSGDCQGRARYMKNETETKYNIGVATLHLNRICQNQAEGRLR